MKILFCFWLFSTQVYAQIEGRWLTQDQKGIIEITRRGDLWFGKIVGGAPVGDGLDHKNPDHSLRTQTILGLEVIKNLKKDGDEWSGGSVYDPLSGNSYQAKAWLEDGHLHLKGYIGLPLFGRSEVWTRINLKPVN